MANLCVLHCLVLCLVIGLSSGASFPTPFTRELRVQNPAQTGADVAIVQHLLCRCPTVAVGSVPLSGAYDQATATALSSFQTWVGAPATGVFDAATAMQLLRRLSCDGVSNAALLAQRAAEFGPQYKYKLMVPVHSNRSIEVNATLLDANNNVLRVFRVRAHGHDQHGNNTWPTYNNTDPGLNEFTADGNTPTGVSQIDLNSPEGIPKLYGPYPINRVVRGLHGNSQLLLPGVRSGILVHTGEWPGWTPSEDMPNSAGCIHGHPSDIESVWHDLVAQGVDVRQNPGGKLPYPYTPQGIIIVHDVDGCGAVPYQTSILLVRQGAWEKAKASGVYTGNAEDRKDGFIHMCTRTTVGGVQRKHFANVTDLLAVEYNLSEIPTSVTKWAIYDNQLYPHIYANLSTSGSSIVGVTHLPPVH